jgi:hypothetical protein
MSKPLTANVTDSNSLGKDYNLLTLDVFDTCLIRDFISQESLWHLLGRDLAARLPGVPEPAEFARLRGDGGGMRSTWSGRKSGGPFRN